MPGRLRIEFGDNHVAEAAVHEAEAPHLAGLLWRALPIDATLRHVRWSGEAAYILVDALRDGGAVLENETSIYPRGSIILRPEHGEVAFAYGQAQARDHLSRGAAGCHLATVDVGLEDFLEVIARTRQSGAQSVRIRAA
jgi:hypothetical protein